MSQEALAPPVPVTAALRVPPKLTLSKYFHAECDDEACGEDHQLPANDAMAPKLPEDIKYEVLSKKNRNHRLSSIVGRHNGLVGLYP